MAQHPRGDAGEHGEFRPPTAPFATGRRRLSAEKDEDDEGERVSFNRGTRASEMKKLAPQKGSELTARKPKETAANVDLSKVKFQAERSQLKQEVTSQVSLGKVKIFQNCSPEFVAILQHHVEPSILQVGEEIIRQGDIGENMYILNRGAVEVVVNGNAVCTLGEGTVFGEIAVLTKNVHAAKRTATIRSKELCVVRKIHRDDLQQTLARFPADRLLFERMAEERLADLKAKGLIPKERNWREAPELDADEAQRRASASEIWKRAKRLAALQGVPAPAAPGGSAVPRRHSIGTVAQAALAKSQQEKDSVMEKAGTFASRLLRRFSTGQVEEQTFQEREHAQEDFVESPHRLRLDDDGGLSDEDDAEAEACVAVTREISVSKTPSGVSSEMPEVLANAESSRQDISATTSCCTSELPESRAGAVDSRQDSKTSHFSISDLPLTDARLVPEPRWSPNSCRGMDTEVCTSQGSTRSERMVLPPLKQVSPKKRMLPRGLSTAGVSTPSTVAPTPRLSIRSGTSNLSADFDERLTSQSGCISPAAAGHDLEDLPLSDSPVAPLIAQSISAPLPPKPSTDEMLAAVQTLPNTARRGGGEDFSMDTARSCPAAPSMPSMLHPSRGGRRIMRPAPPPIVSPLVSPHAAWQRQEPNSMNQERISFQNSERQSFGGERLSNRSIDSERTSYQSRGGERMTSWSCQDERLSVRSRGERISVRSQGRGFGGERLTNLSEGRSTSNKRAFRQLDQLLYP